MKLQVGKRGKLDNPRLLRENDIKMNFFSITQDLSTIWKHLPQHPRSHMQDYIVHSRQIRFQNVKLMNLINLDFYVNLIKKLFIQQLKSSASL